MEGLFSIPYTMVLALRIEEFYNWVRVCMNVSVY